MGTLFDELNKWLKSPVKEKIKQNLEWQKQFPKEKHPLRGMVKPTPNGYQPQSKGVEADPLAAKVVPSAKSTQLGVVKPVLHHHDYCRQVINPGYLSGQYALDTATMAGIHVQSLAYRTGHSPFLAPFALRFSPEQAYVDLGRLVPWDQWKVLWTRIGAHYFQDAQPFDAHEERWLK